MAAESEISGRSVKACRMFKNAIMYLSEFIADRLIANSTPNLPLHYDPEFFKMYR